MPRRLIGDDRYNSQGAYEQMQRLYADVRLYLNFFQPLSRLISEEREGAKVGKNYDEARTPYQQLLAADILDDAKREALAKLYPNLNPVKLRAQIEDALETPWKLTDRSRTPTSTDKQELEYAFYG